MKLFKRLLSLILTVIMLVSMFSASAIVSHADEGVCGDSLTWRFSPASGVLTILGEGEMYDYWAIESPWYPYASQIKTIVLGTGITAISNSAFSQLSELTSVSFPSTLTKINNYAFAWCTSLKSVVIPDNVTYLGYGVFYYCTSLEKAVIGKGITEIKYYTFSDCTSLYDVQFSDNLEIIGEESFYGCTSYENIVLPDHFVAFDYSSFMGTGFYTNPDNWTDDGGLYLDDYLVYVKPHGQDSVIVRPGTKYIAEYAMINIPYLYYVYYPRSVVKVNEAPFYLWDPGATHVDYDVPHAFGYSGSDFYGGTWNISPVLGSCGENVYFEFDETGTILTIYGSGAMKTYDYMYHDYFQHFLGTPWEWVEVFIDELIIDGSITNLNGLPSPRKLTLTADTIQDYYYIFSGSKLEEIEIYKDNPVYASDNGILYSKDMTTLKKYPNGKSGDYFEIPSYVKNIENSAFSNLKHLKTLYIPETVTYIENNAITSSSGVTIQCILNSAAHDYAKANNIPYEILCDHSFTNYTEHPATCTEDGYKSAECDLGCGTVDKIIDEGSALGHSFVDYQYHNDADCTNDGTETALCERGCGTTDTRTAENTALGHLFTDYTVVIQADCTNDEVQESFCDRGCGGKDVVTVDGSAWGHSFVEYTDDNNADYTHDGTRTAKCTVCKASDTIVIDGSAWGHSFTDYNVITETSCTENGIKEALCDHGCGEKDVITEEAIGHTPGEWIIIEEPTYDYEGYRIQNCTVCSEVVNTESVPKLVYEGFPDVPEDAWYYEGVEYCCKQGYIMGTDKGIFDPNGKLTREQFVVILARIAGAKLSEYTESTFTDVNAESWYGPSVIWASENGYVNGVGEGRFGVGEAMTRETVAVMLHRYSNDEGIYTDMLTEYSDHGSVSKWARVAVNWAVNNGILGSTNTNTLIFSPKMSLTRAQAAKIFMSYDAYMNNN